MPRKKTINRLVKIGKISFIVLIALLLISITLSIFTAFYWTISIIFGSLILVMTIAYFILIGIKNTKKWINKGL